jgi:hypothetical protein
MEPQRAKSGATIAGSRYGASNLGFLRFLLFKFAVGCTEDFSTKDNRGNEH